MIHGYNKMIIGAPYRIIESKNPDLKPNMQVVRNPNGSMQITHGTLSKSVAQISLFTIKPDIPAIKKAIQLWESRVNDMKKIVQEAHEGE